MLLRSLNYLLLLGMAAPVCAQSLSIVATINPLGLMARSIGGESVAVEVLLEGGQSPHDFVMSMSHRRQLSRADLILWVGPGLEPYMENLAAGKSVAMEQVITPAEEKPSLHSSHELNGHDHGHHHDDGHLWLNPVAGASMLSAIADTLAELDPVNALIYRQRANRLRQELSQLQVRSKPTASERQFIVAHDAYGGFIETLGYPSPLVASQGAELGPSVRRLWQLGEQVAAGDCLLVDANHKRKWITTFAEKHQLRLIEVDIMGEEAESYLQLLQQLQMKIDECLN